jgi:uncharacterized protein (TIRG00374 family)
VAAIFLVCALVLDIRAVVDVLSGISGASIALIFGLMTVDRLLMSWKWSVLLRALGIEVSFRRILRVYYQSTLAGILLPSGIGGDLLRAYWISNETGARHEVYASLIMEKMVGLVSAANWAFLGLIIFLSQISELSPVWGATVIIAVLLLNLSFCLSLRISSPRGILRPIIGKTAHARIADFLRRLYSAYRRYGNKRQALAWNGCLTVLEHGLQLLVTLTMATSLGLVQSVFPFLAVTAVYLLIYRLPISPDGWGVGEVASISLYGLIGIPPERAFALAFLAHIMQMLVVLPVASLFLTNRSVHDNLSILAVQDSKKA